MIETYKKINLYEEEEKNGGDKLINNIIDNGNKQENCIKSKYSKLNQDENSSKDETETKDNTAPLSTTCENENRETDEQILNKLELILKDPKNFNEKFLLFLKENEKIIIDLHKHNNKLSNYMFDNILEILQRLVELERQEEKSIICFNKISDHSKKLPEKTISYNECSKNDEFKKEKQELSKNSEVEEHDKQPKKKIVDNLELITATKLFKKVKRLFDKPKPKAIKYNIRNYNNEYLALNEDSFNNSIVQNNNFRIFLILSKQFQRIFYQFNFRQTK